MDGVQIFMLKAHPAFPLGPRHRHIVDPNTTNDLTGSGGRTYQRRYQFIDADTSTDGRREPLPKLRGLQGEGTAICAAHAVVLVALGHRWSICAYTFRTLDTR